MEKHVQHWTAGTTLMWSDLQSRCQMRTVVIITVAFFYRHLLPLGLGLRTRHMCLPCRARVRLHIAFIDVPLELLLVELEAHGLGVRGVLLAHRLDLLVRRPDSMRTLDASEEAVARHPVAAPAKQREQRRVLSHRHVGADFLATPERYAVAVLVFRALSN